MATLAIENLLGGYSTNDSRNLEKNQLTEASNFIYNKNARLETSPGYKTFGNAVSTAGFTSIYFHKLDNGTRLLLGMEGTNFRKYNESTGDWDLIATTNWLTEYEGRKTLHECDSTTGNGNWNGTDDAAVVDADTSVKHQGDASIRFELDTAASVADQAVLTNPNIDPVDLTNFLDTGLIRMWAEIPGTANFTEIELRWGDDSSNYWSATTNTQVTGSGLVAGVNGNFIEFDWATATKTGTPDVSSVNYLEVLFKYTSSYNHTGTGSSNAGIDFIAVYPTDSAETTKKTKWDFAPYKNVISMTNGIDPYLTYDDDNSSVTIQGGPGGRYVEYLQDRVAIGGDDLFPHRLVYTDANPASAAVSLFTNAVDVGADDTRRINVLKEIGQSVVTGKNEKSYNTNFSASTALPIDATGGMFANGAIAFVGNALLYQSKRGIEALTTKSGTSSGTAVETKPLSEPIQELIQTITPNSRNLSAGIYLKEIASYYYTFDSNNDNVPDTTVVYSAVDATKSWTLRNFPALYDYTEYEAADGSTQYLFSAASGGQVFQFNTGIDDNGIKIECAMATKVFDFDRPEQLKDFQFVDIVGRKNEGGKVDAEVYVDSEVVSTATVDDTFVDSIPGVDTLGTDPIGTTPIGGSVESADQLWKIRIPVFVKGSTIRVRLKTGDAITSFSPERIVLTYEAQNFDYFPYANIA